MPVYRAPVQDSLFLLNDVLGVERYANLPGFANATPDMIEAVLTEAGKFCEEVLFPINQSGDLEGCTRHDDGSVTTPKGFKEAYKAYCDAGWTLLTQPEEFGGQGLAACRRFPGRGISHGREPGLCDVSGADPGRGRGDSGQGSDEQKAIYAPRMISAAVRDPGQGVGRTEGAVRAQDDLGRVGRDDEPDRAALRHRPRPDPHPRGPERRWQL